MLMDIITKKEDYYNNLNTLLILTIRGSGSDLFEFNIYDLVSYYKRENETLYSIQFIFDGVFRTPKSIDFLNDILGRFYLSFTEDEILRATRQEVRTTKPTKKLKAFQNLESLKDIYIPRSANNNDVVFWSLKLWIEARIKETDFIPYSTLEDYAITHFLDLAKDYSTLKAKCRNLWHWYEARNWQPTKRGKKYKDLKTYLEETKMTRSENAKAMADKKIKENTEKILKAKEACEFLGEKMNITNIALYSKLHRNTVSKYKHLFKK